MRALADLVRAMNCYYSNLIEGHDTHPVDELPRADIPALLDTSERSARRVVSASLDRGVLFSVSTRAPLMLAFHAALASRWMPGLFPEKPG